MVGLNDQLRSISIMVLQLFRATHRLDEYKYLHCDFRGENDNEQNCLVSMAFLNGKRKEEFFNLDELARLLPLQSAKKNQFKKEFEKSKLREVVLKHLEGDYSGTNENPCIATSQRREVSILFRDTPPVGKLFSFKGAQDNFLYAETIEEDAFGFGLEEFEYTAFFQQVVFEVEYEV